MNYNKIYLILLQIFYFKKSEILLRERTVCGFEMGMSAQIDFKCPITQVWLTRLLSL